MKTALLLLLATAALAQDELPQRDGREPFDFEPNLRLYDVKPEAGGKTVEWETPPADLEKTRLAAERAQRTAERWKQLQRKGVLSKVEAERAGVKAVRATLLYQRAHVAALRTRLTSLRERASKNEASPDLVITAQNDLARSEHLLAEAEELALRTDAEFSQNQTDRLRKLAAAGLAPGSKRRK